MTTLFQKRQWEVTEKTFHASTMPHHETIFTIGNGFIGTRGTFEEGYPGDDSTTLAAGIFDHAEGDLVPVLVSIPNWLSLTISINGEEFRLNSGKIMGYERTLDLKTGSLRRGVLWLSPKGTILRLAFERFASLHDQHVFAIQVLIQPLSEGQHEIRVTSALDGTIKNPGEPGKPGVDHWASLEGAYEGERLIMEGRTQQSGYQIGMASQLQVSAANSTIEDVSETRRPAHRVTFRANENEKIWVTKYVTLHTTRDTDQPRDDAIRTLAQAVQAGYDRLKGAHQAEWAKYWDHCDIVIEGDEVAQRAVRFCTYHVLIAAPRHDEGVSIAAKTLSGFGYNGHVFWDTELFILPPLALLQPDLTRRMLMYRYHNLPGARAKAQEAGYEGAMFPWESTDTGEETTPRWTHPHPVTGERIRIWTGDNEQHISTDITYAVLKFWRWTGDDDWFAQHGAEIVLDTAKFWGSRAEYNADKDRYELRMQIGPDEYHENIDNSAFTNRMVVWHLGQARQVWDWIKLYRPTDAQRVQETLDLTPERFAQWETVAQKMWIPMSTEGGGVFEQFENFFTRLIPTNLEDYTPRTTNMDWIMGHAKTQRTRIIKQADVVMMMALLGRELGDEDFLKRNWAVYAPICDHGSSLSPSMHAWVASRLGYAEEAYELFMYSALLDLEDNKGNVRDGIHAACCGGVLQAVLFGFCGLTLTEDGLTTQPALPAHWQRVAFNIAYKGQRHRIEVTPSGQAVSALES